jgi:formylglycine-generating enzyme required for sulfatase activity
MNSLILSQLRWQAILAAGLLLACALISGLWLTSTSAFGSSVAAPPARRLPVRKAAGGDAGQALQAQRQSLQTEHQEKATQLSEQEKVLAQTEEKQRLAMLNMQSKSSAKNPEELAVEKLRAEPITWESLAPQPQDAAELRRIFSTEGADIAKATPLLAASRKAWQDQVREAATSGTKSKEQRIKSLKSMQQLFETKSSQAMVVLKIDDLTAADPLIAAVTKLLSTMTDGTRAVPGQNFTNSVGMDMVWVEEGGFWIGKTEVTSAAYGAINGGGGSDTPKEGVSLINALGYCDKLTTREANEPSISGAKGLHMPVNAQYTLPGVRQWQLARGQAESLGLSGFSDGLSEWTKDQRSSGLTNANSVAFATPDPRWFIICRNDTVEALPPQTTSIVSTSGIATKGSGTAGTVTAWTGRLGFRIILEPPQGQ